MQTLRNSLLAGVVFAKEPTGGLLGGSKKEVDPATGATPPDGPAAEVLGETPNLPPVIDQTPDTSTPTTAEDKDSTVPDPTGGAAAQQLADANAKAASLEQLNPGLTPAKALLTNAGIENIMSDVPKPAPASTQIIPGGVDPEAMFGKSSSQIEAPLSFNVGGDEDDFADIKFTEDGFIEPVAAYKHKNVMRFQVGKFTFQDHILMIYSESDNQEFLDLARGLTPVDRTAIVHYNWRAAANLEKPVNYDSTVSRGSVSTGKTKDPKLVQ